MTIHVTQTQQFIVRAALEASNADERLHDPKLIDDIARAMLVIEGGQMQAYMLRGFNWSCLSRSRREPLQVLSNRAALYESVTDLHYYIDNVRCEASRRIRANRARLAKRWEQYPQDLHDDEDWGMDEMPLQRRDLLPADPANWNEVPRHLPVGHPGEDAA